VHPGDLAGGFSDLYMTWLLYCAGAATEFTPLLLSVLVRDVPDIRFRLAGYPAIFGFPVPAKILAIAGYCSRIIYLFNGAKKRYFR